MLEVQLPDPSADGCVQVRPRLVWLEVVPEEDVGAALHALYIDPAQGSLRGAKALYGRALQRYVGNKQSAVANFLRRQETAQAVQPKQGYLIVQPAAVEEVGALASRLDGCLLTDQYRGQAPARVRRHVFQVRVGSAIDVPARAWHRRRAGAPLSIGGPVPHSTHQRWFRHG